MQNWLSTLVTAQLAAGDWPGLSLAAAGLSVLALGLYWLAGVLQRRYFSAQVQTDSSNKARNLLVPELARLCLWLLRLGIVAGWLYLVSGLVNAEWQQQIYAVLIGPLPGILLVISLGVFAIRIGYRLIDLFFEAIRDGRLLARDRSPRLELRIGTFSGVLKGTFTVVLVTIVAVSVLGKVGVEVGPIIAGAGIVGLAVSFGAQSLVKDVITGFFILFEDQYGVGDFVVINSNDSLSGMVENMNLRITQLRNSEGRLITIPNNAIQTVANLSNRFAQVDLKLTVQHGSDIDRAMALMASAVEALRSEADWHQKILEAPRVLGIDELSAGGVGLRMLVKTAPLEQWAVQRAIRYAVLRAFEGAGILLVGQTAPAAPPAPLVVELLSGREENGKKS
ncbi:mechanosensitive ion channel family protein [Gloeobacter kilaueensis]|uniref:Small conductance mechanosensitive channel n=1 Tax=Gloeobacter kilaueensis (strain ATCC BAA-2537 / CCAP 1431/1 / ULC 316 / JS1) TaxID=1183438 RepID=U5QEQ8_GLOK1|nr:mechanosensitive ion channel family protein [Gloeobacter kilaueensis]AGY57328.1 small conductance mechanosensitive channel [Gloeobacter kilaueensis JS1]